MKQILQKILVPLFLALTAIQASAYDLAIDGIYYNKLKDGQSVEVTYCDFKKYEGSVIIPEQITYEGVTYNVIAIGESAFMDCWDLTSLDIPNSITSIGKHALYSCYSLKSVKIPNLVTEIGPRALYNCGALKSIDIPNSVTEIGSEAFSGCSGLTSIKIPNSITTINWGVFMDCRGLRSIDIPNSVTEIGSKAFSGCWNLTSVKIPDLVTEIGYQTFYQCGSLKSVEMPNSVTVIEDQAFSQCSNLEFIEIPNSVTVIGGKAFERCSNLSSIEIPNSVAKIGSEVFYRCPKLTNLIFNAEKCNFENLALPDNITNITIGANVKEISEYFTTSSERTFWLGNTPPKGAENLTAKVNYVSNDLYSFANQEVYPFLSSKFEVDGNVYIPVSPSERTCDWVVYHKNTEDEDLVIAKTVINRGIEMSVSGLGQYLFENHDYIKRLTVPNTVNKIGNYTLSGCTSLTNFTMEDADEGSGICHIGSNGNKPLFSDCQLNELYIGRELNYYADAEHGYSPFYHNEILSMVTISDAETQIYENEFYGCTNLSLLQVGNGVKTIGNRAFSGCSKLDYFSVGYNVETIGAEAFSDCTGLTKFYSSSIVPPICGTQALDDINKWNCQLYVPAESSDEYAAADQWKEFFFVNEMEAIPAAEILLDTTDATLSLGETLQLTATILPGNTTDKTVNWISSDANVATVSESGLVSAVSVGTVTITARCGEVEAICEVEVVDDEDGIADISFDDTTRYDVYSLDGVLVRIQCSGEELKDLPKGIYIVKSKKETFKIII